jgi:hypothetical protein
LNPHQTKNQELGRPPQLCLRREKRLGAAARLMAGCSRRGGKLTRWRGGIRAGEAIGATFCADSDLRSWCSRVFCSSLCCEERRGETGVVYVCLVCPARESPLVGRTLHTCDYCKERMGLLFCRKHLSFCSNYGKGHFVEMTLYLAYL